MSPESRFARVAIYCYRPGMREEGDRVVRDFISKGTEGLKGHLIMDDLDNPDKAAYVTLGDSEESMIAYFGSIRRDLDDAMDDLTIGPSTCSPGPETRHGDDPLLRYRAVRR